MKTRAFFVFKSLILLQLLILFSINSFSVNEIKNKVKTDKDITVGAKRIDEYINLIKNKRVAIIANHTTTINDVHLVDTLISLKINIVKIFCPEHGFRGSDDAGEEVNSTKDSKTGLPIISLYGNNKKPSKEMLKDIDIIIFDIQDVGVRFYTYISTLTYAMEACAENNIEFLVLDRPNPNGFYVDGPILDQKFKSFVGLHQIPIVHGLTIAEYALMVNEEGWLNKGIKCKLNYVKCLNYSHSDLYQLPIKPSPNLPNMEAVYLYPSLCLFEGTIVSVGRGTDMPFQIFGYPNSKIGNFTFTPISIEGMSKNPPYKGEKCNGFDLRNYTKDCFKSFQGLNLYWLIEMYKNCENKPAFFNNFFNNLAGTSALKDAIIAGKSEAEIEKTWAEGLSKYKTIRAKYLLYPKEE